MHRGFWTPARDRLLKKLYAKVGPAGCASRFGVTYSSAQTRARRVGAAPCRNHPWSAAEDEVLRRDYLRVPTTELARSLDRTPTAVYQRAKKIGLAAGRFEWTEAVDVRFRELYAAGLPDGQIADDLGCIREAVGRRRRSLGLPVNAAALLEARRRAVRSQLRRLGCATLAELRARRSRAIPKRYGLPEDLQFRHVGIILVLAAGPKTRRQIVEALGLKWNPRNRGRNNLKNQNTSYLGELIARDLVVSIRVSHGKGGGQGCHHSVYSLTPRAMDMLASAGKEMAS
jgi:hypothetical protein